jgi:hypothetical protein
MYSIEQILAQKQKLTMDNLNITLDIDLNTKYFMKKLFKKLVLFLVYPLTEIRIEFDPHLLKKVSDKMKTKLRSMMKDFKTLKNLTIINCCESKHDVKRIFRIGNLDLRTPNTSDLELFDK